jgi:hypothetical protein
MEPDKFHHFASNLMGGVFEGYVGEKPHHENSTGHRYIDHLTIKRILVE